MADPNGRTLPPTLQIDGRQTKLLRAEVSVDRFQVMLAEPELHVVPGAELGVLVWRLPVGTMALSSASVGGGIGRPSWVINIRVPADYDGTDLDAHACDVADRLGLTGHGIGLFTAAEVRNHCRGVDQGVVADATCGVRKPTYAASEDSGWSAYTPGTINIVAKLPVALTEAAAVNAVITMTEAKTQALGELSVPGTGTATDAVVVLWDADGAEVVPFAGPRSTWGAPLARATYDAVLAGATLSIQAPS